MSITRHVFDGGELPRIIEFVMNGGLEQSQKKGLEKLHDQAKRERANAAHAMVTASRAPVTYETSSAVQTGEALVGSLSSLFK